MDNKNISKITAYDGIPIANLPSSLQWTRAGLKAGTYNSLDRFRYRIGTNALRYKHTITATEAGEDNEIWTLTTRIDLCGAQEETAHGGVKVPHAQVTSLLQGKLSRLIATAFEVPENDIVAAIDHVAMPPGVYDWLFRVGTGAVEHVLPGKTLHVAVVHPRFALSGDGKQYRLIPQQIMDHDYYMNHLPAFQPYV